MERPWSIEDIAEQLGINARLTADLLRDPDALSIVPKPFGRVGNSRLFDPLVVRAALPEMRAFLAGSNARTATKRAIEERAAQEAQERRRAEFEREAKANREMRETFAAAQENREEVDRRRKAHSGGEAIIVDGNGRRAR